MTDTKPEEREAVDVDDLERDVRMGFGGSDLSRSDRNAADVALDMILRQLATVEADLAKREAMRQVCYDKWHKAEDKLAVMKAERNALRIAFQRTQGAFTDAGSVVVPDEPGRVAEAVGALAEERDRFAGAARMLRATLAALPGDPDEADVLSETAWIDGEGK